MKNSLKRNWKGITATVVAFGAVCGAIYYVNCIYLPGRQQAEAAKLTAIQPVAPPKDYNFAVSTANSQTADTSPNSSDSSTSPANDRIKVTTDQDGNVTVDRTWDAKPGELDTSTAAPSAPTANIGSGGGTITGMDGAYHGEQPTTPSTGTTTTKPASDSSKTTTKPSTTTPTTPPAPAKPSKPTPQAPSSSTPQMGDTRVVDGKEQMYVEGFGWTDVGDGGHTDYIVGDPNEDLGAQVGEMG